MMASITTATFLLLGSILLCSSRPTEATPSNHSRPVRQANSCIYSHTFTNVGEWINLQSEFYPNSYSANLNCRYNVFSPRGTQMLLECNEFNVEYSQNCQYDKLFWSLSGDQTFRDWRFSCGTTPIRQTSNGNSLALGFISDSSNPAGGPFRYQCRISVIPMTCSCGVSGASNRIVGGSQTAVAEFPWRVALSGNKGLFCAGTLISASWILTAAHCTHELEEGERVFVDVGDHDVTITSEAPNEIIVVDHIMENSWYNDQTQENDIALLHLSRPVTFSRHIQPACLPWKHTSTNVEGLTGMASGWGSRYFGGAQSPVMEKVSLTMHNSATCQSIYRGRINIPGTMICAEAPGRDTCQSDSGGSLDLKDPQNGQTYAMGIVSFGINCAEQGSPGLYTDVRHYLGWIEQNTKATFCKA